MPEPTRKRTSTSESDGAERYNAPTKTRASANRASTLMIDRALRAPSRIPDRGDRNIPPRQRHVADAQRLTKSGSKRDGYG